MGDGDPAGINFSRPQGRTAAFLEAFNSFAGLLTHNLASVYLPSSTELPVVSTRPKA